MDKNKQQEISVFIEMTIPLNSKDIYLLWRDFRNLPAILSFINSVTLLDSTHSIWSTVIPSSKELLSYQVEITEDIPYKALYWHSESSTEILHYGSAVFVNLNDSSTQLRLTLKLFLPPLYDSPQISTESLQSQTEEDLRRFLRALKAHEFPPPSLSQEDLPDTLPHPNQPSQPFNAEHKKGDSHKHYTPPPEE